MSKTELEIMFSQEGHVHVVVIDGPIDSATIEEFKSKLDTVCNLGGVKVVLDCANLTYLNSRAIGLLVKYHRSMVLTRGRMAVCNLNSRLVRTLELLQLGKALFIYDSKENALASMG